MPLRRGIAAAAALTAASAAAPAGAQHFEGRASVTAGATYNKVLTDDAYPTAFTTSGPSGSIHPSVSLVYETPRTLNTFTYGLGLNLFLTNQFRVLPGAFTYNNQLGYQGRYELSELSTLTMSLSFNHTPVNTLVVGTDASQTLVDPIPSGALYMLGASVQEGFTRQMSPDLSLTQTTGVTYNKAQNPLLITPATLGFQNSLSLQRQFAVDTLGVQLAVQASYFTVSEATGGAVVDPRLQFSNSLSVTWNRTLNDSFSTAIVLGVTQVVSPNAEVPTAVQPTGSASLNYRLDPAVATISYAHQGAPNIATGSVNFVDTGILRFSTPFGETGLSGTGTGGFTHMTPIGQANVTASNVFMADASLNWRPATVQTLSLALRGQVQRQTGGAEGAPAFTRLSVSFNLTFAYPNANAGPTAPDLPPTLGIVAPTGGASLGPSVPEPSEPTPAAPAPAAPAPGTPATPPR